MNRKNGAATNAQLQRMGDITTDNHNLQEYTYKKITPCDICGQVLRGKCTVQIWPLNIYHQSLPN